MNTREMDFTFQGLISAAIATVRQPQQGAETVLAQRLPVPVLWTMLAAVVAVSVVLAEGSLLLITAGADLDNAYLANPLGMFAVQYALLAVMVLATDRIGRAMGGAGDFAGALAVVTWLQFVMACLQVVQTVTLFIAPPIADLLGIAGLVLFLWLFTNFVAVLHKFRSLGMVFVMIVLTTFGIALVLSLALTMLGVTVPAGLEGGS
ncbi:MAG: YIP1 family protein [Rhodobacteraceae bacterium]|nr:YIP1 family protein [Paracoccaceae bacterium]